MVGVAVAGSVTSNVSGTGVGGSVAVALAVATTAVEDSAGSTGGRLTLMVELVMRSAEVLASGSEPPKRTKVSSRPRS